MERKEIGRQLAFWVMGVLIGIAFAYLSGGQQTGLRQYMGMQNLMNIMYYQMDYRNYFGYLVRRRGLVVVILLFGTMTVMGKFLLSAFIMFIGVSMGTTATFLLMQYKIKGIWLFLSMLLPQMLCYVPAVYLYIRLLGRLHDKVFGASNMRQARGGGPLRMGQMLRMVGVTIMGILLECYVNPIFVKFMIKNL